MASRSPLAASLAALIVLSGCASGRAVPRPFPTPREPSTRGAGTSAPSGAAIAELALSFRGVPYRAGGSDPSGFDCSGFVQYVFAQRGVTLPRAVGDLLALGRPVALEKATPGDLVFFAIDGRVPSHVGIVVDKDRFVHAPSSRGEVRVERIGSGYWKPRLVGIRRVVR